jgi:hypothetical protein
MSGTAHGSAGIRPTFLALRNYQGGDPGEPDLVLLAVGIEDGDGVAVVDADHQPRHLLRVGEAPRAHFRLVGFDRYAPAAETER